MRGIVERDLIRVHPGTTAHGVADAAALPFPAHEHALAAAAADFDGVRYLGRAGTREQYEAVTELERAITRATPAGVASETSEVDAAGTAAAGSGAAR